MDIKDRDHFKTIASAQAGQQDGSQKQQSEESLDSSQFQAYCLRRAQMMLSCYRKDEAQNPETYCAAVAATLALYPKAVVDFVTDPRTGIASENKFLPNVAEVRAACSAAGARLALQSKPSRPRRPYSGGTINEVNLFVPVGFPGYDQMVERSATESVEMSRYENGHVCHDKIPRNGIWVPYKWHDERNSCWKNCAS